MPKKKTVKKEQTSNPKTSKQIKYFSMLEQRGTPYFPPPLLNKQRAQKDIT